MEYSIILIIIGFLLIARELNSIHDDIIDIKAIIIPEEEKKENK